MFWPSLMICCFFYMDYQIEALSDDHQKNALRALIPFVLRDIVKDVIMFRSIHEDVLSVVDLRGIIMECIAGPFMRPDVADVSKTS